MGWLCKYTNAHTINGWRRKQHTYSPLQSYAVQLDFYFIFLLSIIVFLSLALSLPLSVCVSVSRSVAFFDNYQMSNASQLKLHSISRYNCSSLSVPSNSSVTCSERSLSADEFNGREDTHTNKNTWTKYFACARPPLTSKFHFLYSHTTFCNVLWKWSIANTLSHTHTYGTACAYNCIQWFTLWFFALLRYATAILCVSDKSANETRKEEKSIDRIFSFKISSVCRRRL